MISHHNLKFVFIHISKNGGSSVTKTLANYLQKPREELRPEKYKFLFAYQLPSILKHPEDYFIFTIVRNPWARVVSFFHYLQQVSKSPIYKLPKDANFTEWIKSYGFCNPVLTQQHLQLCEYDRLKIHPVINFIASLENITHEWKMICDKLNIDVPLLHDKQTKHKHYREYFTKITKRIVDRHFEKDIELLQYEY